MEGRNIASVSAAECCLDGMTGCHPTGACSKSSKSHAKTCNTGDAYLLQVEVSLTEARLGAQQRELGSERHLELLGHHEKARASHSRAWTAYQ